MKSINIRDQLVEHPFLYKITNSETIIIHRNNKQVAIIKGKESLKIQSKILNKSEQQIQLILAKITGNYKHGNERDQKY